MKVKVWIQLYRPADEAISEKVEFRYKPSHGTNCNRKRPRVTSVYDSNEIPSVITENTFTANMQQNMVPQADINSSDSDIERLFPDLFTNTQNQSEPLLNSEGKFSTY